MADTQGSEPSGNPETTTTETAKAPPATAATGATGWTATLDPEYRTALDPKGWKSPNDMAKSYLELERKIAAKGVIVPGKDATPEQIAEYRAGIGVPASPDKYDIKALGEGFDQNRIKAVLPIFHKAGIPQAAAIEAIKDYAEMEKAAVTAHLAEKTAQQERDLQTLKQAWGVQFDSKSAGMRQAAVQLGLLTKDDLNTLEQSVGTAPMYRFLDQVFQRIGDDDVVGTGALGGFGTTKESAAEEIKKMRAEPALTNKQHPDHKDMVARWNRLIEVRDDLVRP